MKLIVPTALVIGTIAGMIAGEIWSDYRFEQRRKRELDEIRYSFDKPLPGVLRRWNLQTGQVTFYRGNQAYEVPTPQDRQLAAMTDAINRSLDIAKGGFVPPAPGAASGYRVGGVYESYLGAGRLQYLGGDPRKEASWKALTSTADQFDPSTAVPLDPQPPDPSKDPIAWGATPVDPPPKPR